MSKQNTLFWITLIRFVFQPGDMIPVTAPPFIAGEQIFPNGARQTVSQIVFDGDTSGTTMWWRHQVSPDAGPFGGLLFNGGIIGVNFDGTDGKVLFGPNETFAESYIFYAVTLPSAVWFRMSGLFGLAGIKKKLRTVTPL